MKKLIVVIICILSLVTTVQAENYPYRADYLWVTSPDHADWLYRVGEKAVVDVEFYKYGIKLADGIIDYKLADDMLAPDDRGSVKLKDGRARISVGTRRTPGFRDLQLSVTVDGKAYTHHVKVGFSPEMIRPYTAEPLISLIFGTTI